MIEGIFSQNENERQRQTEWNVLRKCEKCVFSSVFNAIDVDGLSLHNYWNDFNDPLKTALAR